MRRAIDAQGRGALGAARACSGALLVLLLAGCASHERRCEGKLEAINLPAHSAAAVDRDHDE